MMRMPSAALVLLAAGLLPAGMASAQTYSRTEAVTYHDNTAIWVLGQTATVTCMTSAPASAACDGNDVVGATTYDASTALPLTVSAFGKLQSTMTYYADGTLKTIQDGNGRTTTLSAWKRGIPQTTTFADSTSRSAIVDDNGWITSTTDENGYTTSYGYDAMGRLASIAYPSGDLTAWAGTSRSFVPVAVAEYGIPAGHWRETVTTGNAVRITYYSGLWRPLLSREYDASDAAGTERFTKQAYDAEGRTTFVSYPSPSSNPTTGMWTAYDALGRVVSVAQDTELNPSLRATTTTYGAGFTTTVINPLGAATTTGYLTYDQPTTDWPTIILAPEDTTTTIVRDPYGKPLSISRGATP